METINQESWNNRDDQFGNNSETATISSDRSGYARGEYKNNEDEDDQNLEDDDLKGRDLDTDNADEWDEDDVNETDLDEDDLRDNDDVNADLHSVKNDQFGSLASSLQTGPTNAANSPDPNEIPEESELDDDDELDYPDDDQMEQAEDDEVSYKENNEVEKPGETEAPTKPATLGDLDSTFTDDNHGRSTGRMSDHEPGSGFTPPEHGAYNL